MYLRWQVNERLSGDRVCHSRGITHGSVTLVIRPEHGGLTKAFEIRDPHSDMLIVRGFTSVQNNRKHTYLG